MCERVDFSEKRKRKKRSRCSSGSLDVPMHMGVDVGGTPNSVELVSEDGNVDRRVKSLRTLEDMCYIRNHVDLNDASVFNNDPMFEEVLGSGDTSYASKSLERKDFWCQVQDSQVTESFGSDQAAKFKGKHVSFACELETSGRSKEGESVMSNKDLFAEGLGSDQAAIFKGKHVSFACELETSGRSKEGESIMSNKDLFAEGLGSDPAAEERCNEIRNLLNPQIHIERPKVVKGELNQDNNENRSIISNGEVQECQVAMSLGSDQAAISKVNHDSDAFELESFQKNNFLGESEKNTYDKTSTLKLEENKEGRSIMFKEEIQECQFSEGFGAISEELLNEMTNDMDARMHIDGINEVPMNMTSEMHGVNDKLNEPELPKPNVIKGEFNQDIKSHFETAATISCENTKQRFNEISNLSDDQSHIGEKKKMPMEMTPNLFICNENLNATGPPEIIIKKEYIEDETVTSVVLADNNYLKLSECLPLSRAGLRSKRMVVILKDALERLWPVLCLEQTSLTSGWSDFRIANNIKSGDACDFRVEDKSKSIVAVDIHHK